MYKDLIEKIQKSEVTEEIVEKTFSQEEALNMLKDLMLKKSEEYKNISPEILEKNLKTAFRNGLGVLSLIHGAYYAGGDMDTKQSKQAMQPQAIERSVAQAPKEGSYQDGKIKNFLRAISLNESSGGKNTNHKTMKTGIHAGDSAYGQYGLMPNTIKEMANRMGKEHPLNNYSKMSNDEVKQNLKKNPKHEGEFASFMANHLNDKFGGDETKMAYSWFAGHNLSDENFKEGPHANYKDHNYVQKYTKHRQQLEKQPVAPSPNK